MPVTHIVTDELKGYGGVRRAYTDIPEGQMHYRYKGSGQETLLLLHMAQSSSDEFTRVIPLLSPHYRVLAPDHLGQGESDEPPRQYEMSDYARSIIGFMDSVNVRSAHILGHHAAAAIAVEIAVTYPERVSSLILTAMRCRKDLSVGLARLKLPEMQTPEIRWDGSHLLDFWERASRFGESVQVRNERALDYFKGGVRGEEMHQAAFKYHILPKLAFIKCPTLLMCGSKDEVALSQNALEALPGSKLVIIDGGTTIMYREIPRDVAAPILEFLKDLKAG